MLLFARKTGESTNIGDDITIVVTKVRVDQKRSGADRDRGPQVGADQRETRNHLAVARPAVTRVRRVDDAVDRNGAVVAAQAGQRFGAGH